VTDDALKALSAELYEAAGSTKPVSQDALHAHHNNDESPANCAACRKALAP